MVLGHRIKKKEDKMGPNNGLPWENGLGSGNSPASSGEGSGSLPSWLSSLVNNSGTMGGLGTFLGGLFGNQGSPYGAAGNAYNKYAQMGAGAISPYNTMGQNAMGNYAKWAQSMSNPSQFENQLMANYQESPNAKFMQQQAMRAGENMGSASGLMGSTPLAMQMQQNAGNISQQDMQNWMSNALGVNQQYGGALGNMMNTGLMGANSLLGLYGQEAGAQGEAAYGQNQGENQGMGNMMNGILGMIPGIASIFGG